MSDSDRAPNRGTNARKSDRPWKGKDQAEREELSLTRSLREGTASATAAPGCQENRQEEAEASPEGEGSKPKRHNFYAKYINLFIYLFIFFKCQSWLSVAIIQKQKSKAKTKKHKSKKISPAATTEQYWAQKKNEVTGTEGSGWMQLIIKGWRGGGSLTTGWVVNDGLTTGFLHLLLSGVIRYYLVWGNCAI